MNNLTGGYALVETNMSISQELLDLYADSSSNPAIRLAVLSDMFDHYVADLPELRQAIDRLICIAKVAKERKQREAA